MFVRSIRDVEKTDFFVDTSHRLLTEQDGVGFTICHTVVRAGTESLLHYRNHLEACYCIGGEGEIEDMEGTIHAIRPGDMYVLDKHDRHYLRGGKFTDLNSGQRFQSSPRRHRAPLYKQSECLFVLSSEMDCLFDGPVVSNQRVTRRQAFFRLLSDCAELMI
ncbi:ectoine synthase [Pseudomonas sp. B21-015]|uniref:ectoine synthase n=1 Tax=unclassified Pseudomonas TaxID=196821 RepID=UPI0038D4F7A8